MSWKEWREYSLARILSLFDHFFPPFLIFFCMRVDVLQSASVCVRMSPCASVCVGMSPRASVGVGLHLLSVIVRRRACDWSVCVIVRCCASLCVLSRVGMSPCASLSDNMSPCTSVCVSVRQCASVCVHMRLSCKESSLSTFSLTLMVPSWRSDSLFEKLNVS